MLQDRVIEDSYTITINNGFLDFFNMIPVDHVVDILDLFDFDAFPLIKGSKKIHIVSMILGINIYSLDFPGKRMKHIIKYMDLLNEIFSGLIHFHGNGNPLIEIEYLYSKQQNQLWYLG